MFTCAFFYTAQTSVGLCIRYFRYRSFFSFCLKSVLNIAPKKEPHVVVLLRSSGKCAWRTLSCHWIKVILGHENKRNHKKLYLKKTFSSMKWNKNECFMKTITNWNYMFLNITFKTVMIAKMSLIFILINFIHALSGMILSVFCYSLLLNKKKGNFNSRLGILS